MSEAPFDEQEETAVSSVPLPVVQDTGTTTTDTDPCTIDNDTNEETAVDTSKKRPDSNKEQDEDTASSSSCEDDGSSTMPLLKYARLVGSLPRGAFRRVPSSSSRDGARQNQALAEPCTCSAMARVVLPLTTFFSSLEGGGSGVGVGGGMDSMMKLSTGGSMMGNSGSNMGTAGGGGVSSSPPVHHILAMGFESGKLYLVDATTGNAIVPSAQLQVHYTGTPAEKLVDVCFDSSGTILAAMNSVGLVAIWELKYTTGIASATALRTSFAQQDDSMFGFFTRNTATSASAAATATPSSSISSLSCSSLQVSRISYPDSFGPPTCFKLDPAYKKRSVKALIVGFTNGRVAMTKRGFIMFGRRSDHSLQEPSGSFAEGGIQALAWRGTLVAWADAMSGIKLYDVESMTRIAHIDRPSGARPSLYPTLSSLKPTLLFETSDSLLAAWGDCVMAMSVQESQQAKRANVTEDSMAARAMGGLGGGGGDAAGTTGSVVKKPKHVECNMAWELDCVACGVVPLDSEHLVVLGLVLPEPDEETDDNYDEEGRVSLVSPSISNAAANNDLEVQVISRLHGNVVHADALPLLQGPLPTESASEYMLLSSYALPRMENALEAEQEGFHVEDEDFEFEVSLFQSTASDAAKRGFKDSHTKWSINELSFDSIAEKDKSPVEEVDIIQEKKRVTLQVGAHEGDEDDAQSEDSDDYELLFRPCNKDTPMKPSSSLELPPIMIVASQSDVVLVRTRDVDDAVAHAIAEGKHAVALGRALCYKRELRRYDINDLINGYLGALLHLPSEDDVTTTGEEEGSKQLSVRRVRLAARALPTLLGGNIGMWEKWVSVFSEIPGALFVLRNHLPVRDPKLSPKLYERALEKMIAEVEGMAATPESRGDSHLLYQQAKDIFLNTLCAWGPTSALRENIRSYSYYDDPKRQKRLGLSAPNPKLDEAESSLLRRLHQTAVGFLEFPIASTSATPAYPAVQSGSPLIDAADALFSVERLLSAFSSHTPLIPPANKTNIESMRPGSKFSHVALDALAELNLMGGMYEKALQCFLTVGCLYASQSLSVLEDEAVSTVSAVGSQKKTMKSVEYRQYAHVIALIEYHHLHYCLLKDDFISSPNEDLEEGDTDKEVSELLPPLISLIRLVGLDFVGDFLVEHCISPVRSESYGNRSFSLEANAVESNRVGNTTLPLNLVANQFASRPKLLYWFLNLLFEHKPEIYVKFPTTAVPPSEIRELHRKHLDLSIRYAGSSKDSVWFMSNEKASSTDDPATSLLKFLKAVLALSGVRPDEVRRLLEAQRAGNDDSALMDTAQGEVKFPNYFALELAYVMEHYGKSTEEEATAILDLYLKGAKSLSLAAFYAQRNTEHSSLLWGCLLDHCLSKNQNDDSETATGKDDGTLFGSLLEAAALSGADLAHLVTEIPQGMRIEGLRPRLVAAVTDYRLKLQMHKAAVEVIANDRISLLRELGHRSRRGMRYQVQQQPVTEALKKALENGKQQAKKQEEARVKSKEESKQNAPKQSSFSLSSTLRPSERRSQRRLSFSLPVR